MDTTTSSSHDKSFLRNPPSLPPQHLPRAFLRIWKYVIIVFVVLGYIYTLSHLNPSLPILPQPAIPNNHTLLSPSSPNLPKIISINNDISLPIIGKVTASFGPRDPVYEAAIASHLTHNTLHNYPHFILREQMVHGLWAKHACLLTIIGSELAKPEALRLKWLFWHDRDTILMNPNIDLDVFLPPEPEFDHINLLATRDRNGLNNGVFFVRVNEWALKFFASALSMREYKPEVELKFSEQSAMEETMKRPWWNSSVAYVPQRWFNGFPPSHKSSNSSSAARPGSLLIHFASNRDGLRPERMARWGEVARNETEDWHRPFNTTGYSTEIEEYWQRLRNKENMEQICDDIGKRSWD